ncbi:MAG TPA: ComEC/Rec2 family competence protein, partial [Ktedonobacterales bacterium]
GLLIGILLGLKTLSLRARLPLFTATGTIHLVVPAGLKVSLLAALASDALRPLGRWPRVAGAIGAVVLYAALGGSGPPAVRAAIMGTLLVLAPALGRGYNVFTSLALAVLVMTAIEPLVIYDAGFQLTALATLGLPLFVPPIQSRLTSLLRALRLVPAPALVGELLAVTLAAQLATLPVLALTFHLISFVAPFANLLTVPLLALLLILGGALAVVALASASVPALGIVAIALAWFVWPLLAYVDSAIALCASLPYAALTVGDLSPLVAWAYYAALSGAYALRIRIRAWLTALGSVGSLPSTISAAASPSRVSSAGTGGAHHQLGRRVMVALLVVALLGGLGASAPALAEGASAHLDFLDVGGGGEAALLRLPSGVTALVNGGPDGPALESALATRLPFWQRSLDLAVLTDSRTGDLAGLEDAVAHYHVTHAADAGMLHPTQQYLAWLDALSRAGDQHTRIRTGNVIQLDASSSLTVLAPPQQLYPPREGDTTASDDLILRLTTPGLRALFLGSADAYALDALAGSGEPLAADVVELALVPGASLDLSGPLGDVLRAAHPRLVVVCDAPVTPGSKTESKLLASAQGPDDTQVAATLGALIYRTSAAGTISLSGGAEGWSLGT